MKKKTFIIYLSLYSLIPQITMGWGFFAHRKINEIAVFSLPTPLFGLYKRNLQFIIENSVNPDKRRYVIRNEAYKHFIDVESYEETFLSTIYRDLNSILKYDTKKHIKQGILPWNILTMQRKLTDAFKKKDIFKILKLSADVGHYIADAHVPLHTTKNYDGQLNNQEGVHTLWETRIPELFGKDYDLFVGKAKYIKDMPKVIFNVIKESHNLSKVALEMERKTNQEFTERKKYSYEYRGKTLTKMHTIAYAAAYQEKLNGQVEQQMRLSIKLLADFWFTCWVDAGKPDLTEINQIEKDYMHEDYQEKFPTEILSKNDHDFPCH